MGGPGFHSRQTGVEKSGPEQPWRLRIKEQPLERVVHGRAVVAHATDDRRAHSWTSVVCLGP